MISDNKKSELLRINKQFNILFMRLGMSSVLNGFNYLKDAIVLTINKPDIYMMDVYKKIAKKYDIKWERVERCLRYLFEVSMLRGDIILIDEMFSYTIDKDKGKPTNREFVKNICNYIYNYNHELFESIRYYNNEMFEYKYMNW